ncbi:MAG: 60S ribosomal export protein NMD3 [Candidatus Thorarchaeota archaeon]
MMLIELAAPCYLCGKEAVVEGLCNTCYDDQHPLMEVSTPLPLIACKKCGSVKVPGGWQKISIGKMNAEELAEKQIDIILDQEIKLFYEGVSLTIEEVNKLDRVIHLMLTATGKSHESIPPHDEEYPVEIRFRYSTCDTCGMMSGGYYEAILQIRADSREISDEEKKELTKRVTDMTVARYKTDEKAFVNLIDDTRHGIDYYIGSEHLAKDIADDFEGRYIAERKENYKLVGEDKTGKKKYRITILLRFPQFSNGDFVLVAEQPCQILAMGHGNLTCYNLVRRERFTINQRNVKWRTIQFLAPMTDRREFMIVTHVFGQPVQIMDSENFEVTEVEESVFDSEIISGEKIHGIIVEEQLHILPDQTIIEHKEA